MYLVSITSGTHPTHHTQSPKDFDLKTSKACAAVLPNARVASDEAGEGVADAGAGAGAIGTEATAGE